MIAIIVIVIVVIVAAAAIGAMARRRQLQRTFGSEYEQVAAGQPSKMRADAELSGRIRRVRKLNTHALSPDQVTRYAGDWMAVQERFVDSPEAAVADAYDLVISAVRDQGYPVEDTDQVAADLSVEHGQAVTHFRAALDISQRTAGDGDPTEDMRQALIHYRELVADLLDDPSLLANGHTADAAGNGRPALPGNRVAGGPAAGNDLASTNQDSTVPDSTVPDSTVPDSTIPGSDPADTIAGSDAGDLVVGSDPASATAAGTRTQRRQSAGPGPAGEVSS